MAIPLGGFGSGLGSLLDTQPGAVIPVGNTFDLIQQARQEMAQSNSFSAQGLRGMGDVPGIKPKRWSKDLGIKSELQHEINDWLKDMK